jgi:hypothetical protein
MRHAVQVEDPVGPIELLNMLSMLLGNTERLETKRIQAFM